MYDTEIIYSENELSKMMRVLNSVLFQNSTKFISKDSLALIKALIDTPNSTLPLLTNDFEQSSIFASDEVK